jgi:hypothetical protein
MRVVLKAVDTPHPTLSPKGRGFSILLIQFRPLVFGHVPVDFFHFLEAVRDDRGH